MGRREWLYVFLFFLHRKRVICPESAQGAVNKEIGEGVGGIFPLVKKKMLHHAKGGHGAVQGGPEAGHYKTEYHSQFPGMEYKNNVRKGFIVPAIHKLFKIKGLFAPGCELDYVVRVNKNTAHGLHRGSRKGAGCAVDAGGNSGCYCKVA